MTADPTRGQDLRAKARAFAAEVLRDVKATAERLPTAEDRFLATRPAYERLVAEGFLRACIPAAAGGDNESLLDTAVVVEELFAENPSVALTLLATVLGLQPVVAGGTPDQQKRLLAPFLETTGAPLAAFCSTEPGGSANPAAPPPGEGVRTRAASVDGGWLINGVDRERRNPLLLLMSGISRSQKLLRKHVLADTGELFNAAIIQRIHSVCGRAAKRKPCRSERHAIFFLRLFCNRSEA